MLKTKVLLAGCSNPVIATDVQTKLQNLAYKINVIGELNNLFISVALDKPSVVLIHFHEFTHNAIQIAKELYEKHGVESILLVSSNSFKEAVDIAKNDNLKGCLKIPFSKEELKAVLECR